MVGKFGVRDIYATSGARRIDEDGGTKCGNVDMIEKVCSLDGERLLMGR
jgi:hypothetical protein